MAAIRMTFAGSEIVSVGAGAVSASSAMAGIDSTTSASAAPAA